MIMHLFSIKDEKVGFTEPFSAVNTEDALRRFVASVRSRQPNPCNTFPEDKFLCRVGTFDTNNGVITAPDADEGPEIIAHALAYVLPVVPAPKEENTKKEASDENDV